MLRLRSPRSPSCAMPLATLKVPTPRLGVEDHAVGGNARGRRHEHHVADRAQLAGLDVHLQIVGEELLAGVGGAGLAFDLDLAHQPHVVGVDPLERELLGVPAGQGLRGGVAGREQRGQRARQDEESNTHVDHVREYQPSALSAPAAPLQAGGAIGDQPRPQRADHVNRSARDRAARRVRARARPPRPATRSIRPGSTAPVRESPPPADPRSVPARAARSWR